MKENHGSTDVKAVRPKRRKADSTSSSSSSSPDSSRDKENNSECLSDRSAEISVAKKRRRIVSPSSSSGPATDGEQYQQSKVLTPKVQQDSNVEELSKKPALATSKKPDSSSKEKKVVSKKANSKKQQDLKTKKKPESLKTKEHDSKAVTEEDLDAELGHDQVEVGKLETTEQPREESYNPGKSRYDPIADACWAAGDPVPYLALAKTFEATPDRLRIMELLCNFLRSVRLLSPGDLLPCVYLCLNQLAPAYEAVELGVGDSVLMKAMALSTGSTVDKIKQRAQTVGDLGAVSELLRSRQAVMGRPKPLTVAAVLQRLREIADMSGNTAQQRKVSKILSLLVACRQCEAKYLIRSLSGRLRIGLAELSVLSALGHAVARSPDASTPDAARGLSPEAWKRRQDEAALLVRTAYCQCPNYALLLEALLSGEGLAGLLARCQLRVGVPLKPMLAHPTKGVGEEFSVSLSAQMQTAGFCSANARIQSAMASVQRDIFRSLLKTDNLHTFGSFNDGWGSCLTKLDGSIEPGSDMDVTFIIDGQKLHLCDEFPGVSDCPAVTNHRCVKYEDGHVNWQIRAAQPNVLIKKSKLMPAVDLIPALPCCNYPSIAVLRPGYHSHMSGDMLRALRAEVQSPRCHVVAAAPPGLEGSRMRVSTTLLEAIVMHNLNTIQGQFFILLKFLIKKEISRRVNGLKTYIAKNLLFYMLDRTPEEDWRPENLLKLVRKSLQILVTMMESMSSADACMTHFFLQDATVYLRKDHQPKQDIVQIINESLENLPDLFAEFARGLLQRDVTRVHFSSFLYLLFLVEFVQSPDEACRRNAYRLVWDASAEINEELSEGANEQQLACLLLRISEIPDCVKVTRDCLKAMAYLRAGKSLDEAAEEFEFPISRGIRCPVDTDAREAVLNMLYYVMKLDVSNGCIRCSSLEREFSGLVLLLRVWSGTGKGLVPRLLSAWLRMLNRFGGTWLHGATTLAVLKFTSSAFRKFINYYLQLHARDRRAGFVFLGFIGLLRLLGSGRADDSAN